MLETERIISEDEYYLGMEDLRPVDRLLAGSFAEVALIGWDGAVVLPVMSYGSEVVFMAGDIHVVPIKFKGGFSERYKMDRLMINGPGNVIVSRKEPDLAIGYVMSYFMPSWRERHGQSLWMNSLGACGHSEL